MAKTYNVKAISQLTTDGIVNIKAGPYYITYNLKRGINSGIANVRGDTDYTNEVVIHKGLDIPFGQTTSGSYFTTSLVGNLSTVGNIFQETLSGNTLKVKLCKIDKIGQDGAWLSIGLNAETCNDFGPVVHPQGIQLLTDGVPTTSVSAAKDRIVEFKMNLPIGTESVSCRSSGGKGDTDLILNLESSPQVLFEEGVNTVSFYG